MKHSQMYFLAMIIAFCTNHLLLGLMLVFTTLMALKNENTQRSRKTDRDQSRQLETKNTQKDLEPIKSQLIKMSVKNITRSNGKIVMVTIPLEKLARFIFMEKDVQYARGVDNTTRLAIRMRHEDTQASRNNHGH